MHPRDFLSYNQNHEKIYTFRGLQAICMTVTVTTRNDCTNLPTQFLIAYFEKYQLPPRRTLAHTLDRKKWWTTERTKNISKILLQIYMLT